MTIELGCGEVADTEPPLTPSVSDGPTSEVAYAVSPTIPRVYDAPGPTGADTEPPILPEVGVSHRGPVGPAGPKGDQGDPGPQGPPGSAGSRTVELPAGEVIGGIRAVVNIGDQWFYANPDTAEHAFLPIYLSLQAGNPGTLVTALAIGQVVEPGAGWTASRKLYLAPNGHLTHALDLSTLFTRVLAVAETPSKILYDPRPGVIRVN